MPSHPQPFRRIFPTRFWGVLDENRHCGPRQVTGVASVQHWNPVNITARAIISGSPAAAQRQMPTGGCQSSVVTPLLYRAQGRSLPQLRALPRPRRWLRPSIPPQRWVRICVEKIGACSGKRATLERASASCASIAATMQAAQTARTQTGCRQLPEAPSFGCLQPAARRSGDSSRSNMA